MRNGIHAAVIMDGNGRWATRRGLPRVAGHRRGARAVRRTVEAAPELGISTLTLFAFSSDNWQRPPDEVASLMDLFGRYLTQEIGRCVEEGVRVAFVGRRDRLSEPLRGTMLRAEAATAEGDILDLRIAIDYSARDAILEAARRSNGGRPPNRDEFARALAGESANAERSPDVDLLIRTGGEQRLSDFLLWEAAYAELVFTPVLWPDFGKSDLAAAVGEFRRRERRFGRVPEPMAATG